MAQGGFFERKRISPTGVTIVVLLHGAAITALAMSKMDMPAMKVFTPLKIDSMTEPPEPAPVPEPKDQPEVRPKQQVDYVKPLVPPPPSNSSDVVIRDTPEIPTFTPNPPGEAKLPPADPPKPIPSPERVGAQMLRASELQPPYPAYEQRAEVEGSVAIRVTIAANGRVIRAEKVSATTDGFYKATERHALRSWRFKPATVDGKPVESVKTINVRFQLDS